MAWTREYHTEILIRAGRADVWRSLTDFGSYPEWNPLVRWLRGELRPGGEIRMFIAPLNRSFPARIQAFLENEEMTWVGTVISPWILSGEHYYRLRAENARTTRLLHGESFRGLASGFISRSVLRRMESAFVAHNWALKRRVEAGLGDR